MKLLKLILINLLILLLLLTVVDPFLAAKKVTDRKTFRSLGLREYGPNRDVILNPYGHDVDTTTLDRKSYILKTDDFGFIIGPGDNVAVPPAIVFYGGSTTECAFVDDSLRFPYLVGKMLGVRTGNAGYGGNHSFHSLINLLGKGVNERPKTVVWMHNINDLALLSKTGSYFVSPDNRKILTIAEQTEEPSFLQRGKQFVAHGILFLYPNIYKRFKSTGQSASAQNVDEWAGYRDFGKFDYPAMESEFRSSLQSFIGIAKANGIDVVLMTQFNRILLDDNEVEKMIRDKNTGYTYAEFVQYYQSFNQVIRETAQKENIRLIDLDSLVPKTPTYLYDAVHVNNAGSKLVAGVIVRNLDLKDLKN